MSLNKETKLNSNISMEVEGLNSSEWLESSFWWDWNSLTGLYFLSLPDYFIFIGFETMRKLQ